MRPVSIWSIWFEERVKNSWLCEYSKLFEDDTVKNYINDRCIYSCYFNPHGFLILREYPHRIQNGRVLFKAHTIYIN